MKKIFTFLFIAATFISYASDSLKVKRVRFFVEPKASFIIPTHKYYSGSFNSANVDWDPISPPSINYSYTWNNKISANFGISAGLSVKLCKHFYYEFSVAYSHYVFSRTQTGFDSIAMSPFQNNRNIYCNFLSVSNGIVLKYGRFIINNNVHIGIYFTNKIDKSTFEDNLLLMSEHKIGYVFFKDKIEAYVGVNILYYSCFNSYFNESNFHYYNNGSPNPFAMPFVSLRANF